MSKMNLLIHLNAYRDVNDTNNPSLNHFKWDRDLQGLDASEPTSKCVNLQPGQTLSLFSGTVSTSDDNTTTWDIALKSGSSNVYRVSHAAGTAPVFRTARTSGADATTSVTVTRNAKLSTFTSTAGTPFALVSGGVVVGDEVRVGDLFEAVNRGKYKIIALTATSFTVENELGTAQGPVILGAGFADEINIYSADGVQIGDKIDINDGFSSVTFGTYEIVDVSHDYIDFFNLESLPVESGISNNPSAFLIYRDAKSFLFIESDKKLDISLNGSKTNEIIPMTAGIKKKQGFFMSSASIKSASITNKDLETATVFFVTAE